LLVSQTAINQGLRLFAAFVCGFATSNLYNRLDWRLPVELYALALLVVVIGWLVDRSSRQTKKP